jgi:hypothetical protein
VCAKAIALTLLIHKAIKPRPHLSLKHNIVEARLWICCDKQILQLAARAWNRDGNVRARSSLRCSRRFVLARGVNKPAQLVGDLSTASARLVGSHLQRDWEKLLFITLIVAA